MMLSAIALAEVEQKVLAALASGDLRELDVIGFGEINTVLRARGIGGLVACKRLLPFRRQGCAQRAAEVIVGYVRALRDSGVDVVDTEVSIVSNSDGHHVVYCLQPALPQFALGPAHVRELETDEAAAVCTQVLRQLKEAVSETLAPDGQLSNWAFIGSTQTDRLSTSKHRLVYLDVTTPFWRDAQGCDRFDFTHVLMALPAVVRAPVRRFALKRTLDTYFTLRGQALDFLGNLHKERLGHLVPVLLPVANRVLALEPPILAKNVESYYIWDARRYAGLQGAARARCWFQLHVMNRPYPFVPKPRIARYS